ncbi:MAG TPA: GGDEF domain-containing protein, partial [Dehalococcoidia bacterium]|jgi:diguanylate cyclase (GGDEF)-like protein/PAS domain S-box-containing protein|nr:GGDEF domain-containing protein [Dehalococcoidia bacterium]
VLDAAGACRYLSPSVEHLLRYQPDALIGRSFFLGVHPDDAPRVLHQHLDVLATQMTGPATEFRYRDAHGEWHTLEASFTNLLRDPSVAGIVVNARDVTMRAREQERVVHLAFHDALTGLPNRALLLDRLAQTLARQVRGGGNVAVMYLDLDHFKQVNDTLGHAAGDALLIEVATRLQSCVRPGDTVARLGGDEFALILEDVDDADPAVSTAERLLERLSEPVPLEGTSVHVGTSIGIALSERGESAPESLLRQADTALYRAKAAGRGCYRIYDPSMQMEGAA